MQLRSSIYGWKSVWMDLADERKGEFLDGGNVVTVRLPIADRPWKITFQMQAHPLGKSLTETTICAAPFVARHPFRFAIRNSRTIEELIKVLGMQDIIVGDEVFDKDYIIQGNHPEQVKEFFACPKLKEKIQSHNSMNLSIMDSRNNHFGISPPPHENVLAFVEKGTINSFSRISSLVDLMVGTLDRLHELSIAAPEEPSYSF
jgi:hypothetical protein